MSRDRRIAEAMLKQDVTAAFIERRRELAGQNHGKGVAAERALASEDRARAAGSDRVNRIRDAAREAARKDPLW